MLACLVTLSPLDKTTGERFDVRLATVSDRRVCALGGMKWEPAITQAPAIGMQFWNGDFETGTEAGKVDFSFNMKLAGLSEPRVAAAIWSGANVEIMVGRVGAAWPWTIRLRGKVTSYSSPEWPSMRISAEVDTEPFNRDVLVSTYAGTGDAEGGEDLRDRVKPLALGRPRNVEPVLINTVDSVYQFSGYGPIEAVEVLYERAGAFPAASANYATYAELVAADIAPGHWATCLAQGLIRLGAPAAGVITGDISGHAVGAAAPRGAGALVEVMADIAGVDASLVGSASLAALDAEGSTFSDVMVTEQVKFLEAARRLILPCNWQVVVSNLGVLRAMKPAIAELEQFTLHAQGKRTPLVSAISEGAVSLPYRKTVMAAERSWRVHSFDEIMFAADLIDRGDYQAATIYREGNIVTMPDGGRWLFVSTNPVAGVTPGSDDAVWSKMTSGVASLYSARLTNDSDVISADANGNVASFAGLGGRFIVEDSAGNEVPDAAFAVSSESGVDVSIDAGTGVYTVAAMSQNTGFATLTATVGEITFEKTYSVAKSLAGAKGDPGEQGAPGAPGTPGEDGAPGTPAVSGFLTNEAVSLWAYANGVVESYAGATSQFRIFSGSADISANFTLSSPSNPQSLNFAINGRTFAITGGFDPDETTASITFRATGSGAYAGIVLDKVFTLTKTTGGYEIVAELPTDNLFAGRIVFLESDSKLYRYTGSQWTAAVQSSDIAGQILAEQIDQELTGQVQAHGTEIDDLLETYGSTASAADSAASAAASANVASATAAGLMNPNPIFADWLAGAAFPTRWTDWSNATSNISKSAGEVSSNAVRLAAPAGSDCGLRQSEVNMPAALAAGDWVVIEADIKLNSGSLVGAGVLLRGTSTADARITFATDLDTKGNTVGAGVAGTTYRFRKLIQMTAGTNPPALYLMSHWSIFGSVAEANNITWYRCGWRLASTAEVKTGQIDGLAASIDTMSEVLYASSPNLLPNGGLEQGTNRWVMPMLTGNVATYGNWGTAMVFGEITGNGEGVLLRSEPIPIYGGSAYTFAGDMMMFADTSAAYLYLDVEWLDANNNQIGETGQTPLYATADFSTAASRRTTYKSTGTAPANASFARCRVVVNPAGTRISKCGVRLLKLESGNVATPYSNEASLAIQGGAIAGVEDKTAAYLNIHANAGTANAIVVVRADGSGESNITLGAQKIVLGTVDGSTFYDALVIENGNATFAGALRAGSVSANNLAIGTGGNLLVGTTPGTDPNDTLYLSYNPGNVSYSTNGTAGRYILSPNYGSSFPSSGWTLPDNSCFAIYQPNYYSGTATYSDFYFRRPINASGATSNNYPAQAGKTYEFSLYTGAHRCDAWIYLRFVDANNNTLAYSGGSSNLHEKNGGTTLDGYKRLVTRAVAPSGTVAVCCMVRKGHTLSGNTDSWLFMARPQLTEVGAYVTEATPWVAPGGTFINGSSVITKSITTDHIAAGAITTNEVAAGTVTAAKINVTDLSAITGNIGTLTTGTIRNAADTYRIDATNGRSIMRAGGFMKVSGAPFGSNSQFLEWYGPEQANLANCTETNAIQYLKTDGSAYFGGSLSAGTLKNAGQSSSIASNASISIGPSGSNGNPISVALSYACRSTTTTNYGNSSSDVNAWNSAVSAWGAPTGESVNASKSIACNVVVRLERGLGGGAVATWTNLTITSCAETITGVRPVANDNTGYLTYTRTVSGSLTATDSAGTTQTRQFVATITDRSNGTNGSVTSQTISIVATEQ